MTTETQTAEALDEKTAAWVADVVRSEGGDKERAARWIRKLIRCTIGEARGFVAQAAK